MNEAGTIRFFNYARERYSILLRRREGHDRPWTIDPILQSYRFCNIFREDDTTTQWFKREVRYDNYDNRDIMGVAEATVIFRWFNRIETGQILVDNNLLFNWNADRARRVLGDQKPLVTGAFMVKTPAKMNKLEGLIQVIESAKPFIREMELACSHGCTLEEAHGILCQAPYLGPFMAYEVITDLRHTYLLRDATDIMTWASPGPGAARGAGRVYLEDPKLFNRHRFPELLAIQTIMQGLLEESQDPQRWPGDWPAWEMREVEHTLCEFDKYERVRLGEGTPKQRYNGRGA